MRVRKEKNDIVSCWSRLRQNSKGKWIHPEDGAVLAHGNHSFNLDHPVTPYIGDILNSPMVILGANGGISRRIVAKRLGLWEKPPGFLEAEGVVVDHAPVSKHLTGIAWQVVQESAP